MPSERKKKNWLDIYIYIYSNKSDTINKQKHQNVKAKQDIFTVLNIYSLLVVSRKNTISGFQTKKCM